MSQLNIYDIGSRLTKQRMLQTKYSSHQARLVTHKNDFIYLYSSRTSIPNLTSSLFKPKQRPVKRGTGLVLGLCSQCSGMSDSELGRISWS